jgi:hypothetical protein
MNYYVIMGNHALIRLYENFQERQFPFFVFFFLKKKDIFISPTI